jgi:preprotein translocase subunit SecD
MNRYPGWKYAILAIALLVGLLYTAPNFFGEAPAVQITSGKSTFKLESKIKDQVSGLLADAGLTPEFIQFEGGTLRVRFNDTDAQLKARDVLNAALNPDPSDPRYNIASNLLSRSPQWMSVVRALPMYLGLDLRGGVHFLMQVDMRAVLVTKAESMAREIRTQLRDKNIATNGISREGNTVVVRFRDAATMATAHQLLADKLVNATLTESTTGTDPKLTVSFSAEAAKEVQSAALKQNISTLHNRVNELGVSEPVIQQQGFDRVVVQLPGIQDMGKARAIIQRTATLQVRMVDESAEGKSAQHGQGPVPFGSELFANRDGAPLMLQQQVLLTGENLVNAQSNFDQQTHQPVVELVLDDAGARIFKEVTRENVGKHMAILLFERGKGCCYAPARWPHRWRSSKRSSSARRSAKRTSRRASTA